MISTHVFLGQALISGRHACRSVCTPVCSKLLTWQRAAGMAAAHPDCSCQGLQPESAQMQVCSVLTEVQRPWSRQEVFAIAMLVQCQCMPAEHLVQCRCAPCAP